MLSSSWNRSLTANNHQNTSTAQQNPSQRHVARCALPAHERPSGGSASREKLYDVVGLSNLCVDVVVNVPALPPKDEAPRKALLQKLMEKPLPEEQWEVGGNCNCLIAAARLGMKVGSIGHVGSDVYGDYMDRVMQQEGIDHVLRIMPQQLQGTKLDETLLCFVLVDPQGKHSFVSAYDFGPWPLLQGVSELPTPVIQALQSTAAVFTNGFVFDELPLDLIETCINTASRAGAAVCFDPGPRAFTMQTGSRRQALDMLLDLSHVVLMTEEEAVQVTGHSDPQAAAAAILSRPSTVTDWCVVKMGGQGALLMTKGGQVHHAPAFQVEVKDTVGCGDSFAAAIALGYCRTHDVAATLLLANAVGAATAMGRGAGTNVAKADTVMQLLHGEASSSSSVDGVFTNTSSSNNGGNGSAVSSGKGNGSSSSSKHKADVFTAIDVLRSSLATVEDDDMLSRFPGPSHSSSNCGSGNSSSSTENGARSKEAARAA